MLVAKGLSPCRTFGLVLAACAPAHEQQTGRDQSGIDWVTVPICQPEYDNPWTVAGLLTGRLFVAPHGASRRVRRAASGDRREARICAG